MSGNGRGPEVVDLVSDDEPGPSSRPPAQGPAQYVAPKAKGRGRKRKAAEQGEQAAAPARAPARASKGKGKKGEEEKRVDPAGRTVRFSAQPSKKVEERIARALPGSGHRLFLIDRKVLEPVGTEGGAAEEFAVLGATGNVYTVTVCRQPACTCPDFLKNGGPCKHVLFCMLRVLRLPRNEPLVWQRALLTKEVDAILSGEKSERRSSGGGDVLAGVAVRDQYRRLSTGGAEGAGPSQGAAGPGRQRPLEADATCPICFDELDLTARGEDKVTFCAGSCGNSVHVGCIRRWTQNEQRQGLQASCPFCRAKWVDGLDPGSKPGQPPKYANLAQFSEAHQGAQQSLEELYGDRALWIRANQGDISRRDAANMWRNAQGGW